jgi:hypothetical protein
MTKKKVPAPAVFLECQINMTKKNQHDKKEVPALAVFLRESRTVPYGKTAGGFCVFVSGERDVMRALNVKVS